jgi:phosphate:Na+ symporter
VYARLVEKLVPGKDESIPRRYSLRYLSVPLQDTPQLYMLEARKEISKMAQVIEDMFQQVLTVFQNPDRKMGEHVEQVQQMEELTDQMQEEISRFLLELTNEELSEKSIRNLHALIRVAHELESIGDSCFHLLLLTRKKYERR